MDSRLRQWERDFYAGDLDAGMRLARYDFGVTSHPVLLYCLKLLDLTDLSLKYMTPNRRINREGVYDVVGNTYHFTGIYRLPEHECRYPTEKLQYRRASLHVNASSGAIGRGEEDDTLVQATFYMNTAQSDSSSDSRSSSLDFRGVLGTDSPLIRADSWKPFLMRKGYLRQVSGRTLFAWGDFEARQTYYQHPEELLIWMAKRLRKPEEDIIDALQETGGNISASAVLLKITRSQLRRQIAEAGLEEEVIKARGKRRFRRNAESEGDCFYAAVSHMQMEHYSDPDCDLILVHAEVTSSTGRKHGHAFVLKPGWTPKRGERLPQAQMEAQYRPSIVYDVSQQARDLDPKGDPLVMQKEAYYYYGQIGDNLYEYTLEEMNNKLIEYGHYGPWDLETEHEGLPPPPK